MHRMHRAGLNRVYQWINPPRLWEAGFKQGLNTEVVTFSTRLSVQPSPLYKSNGGKARWQPPIYVSCCLIGPNGFAPLFRSSSVIAFYMSTINSYQAFTL